MSLNTGKLHRLALYPFLFSILFCVYILTYSGVPISDDEQLFASTAINLALFNDLDANQMYGNLRIAGKYNNAGPLHILIASFLYQLISPTKLGIIQAFYLLNIFYTALTGVILCAFARLKGYSTKESLCVTILFSLCTIAWPYSKTFFREPLAALLLLISWLLLEMSITPKQKPNKFRLLFFLLFLLSLGGALLSKIILIVSIPGFAWIIGRNWKNLTHNFRASPKAPNYFLVIGALIFFFTIILINKFGGIYRFSTNSIQYIFERAIPKNHPHFWKVILGSLVSPGKGFLVYSPPVLLAFMYFKSEYLNNRQIAFPVSVFIGMLIVQALIYDKDWWNVTWSTRYLIPVIPLLMMAGLPVIRRIFTKSILIKSIIIGTISGIGFIIQVSNVLVAPPRYNSYLFANLEPAYPGPAIWDVYYAPIIGQWRIILAEKLSDLALYYALIHNPNYAIMVSILVLIILGISIKLILKILDQNNTKSTYSIGLLLTFITIILLPWLVLQMGLKDPRYYGNRVDIQTAHQVLVESIQPGDVVVVQSYNYPIWQYLMNFGRISYPWYSIDFSHNHCIPAFSFKIIPDPS